MECSDPNKIEKGTSSKSKRKRKSEMEEGSSSKSKRKRTSEIEEAKAGPRILLGTCGSTANRNFGHVCTQFKNWGETKAVITDATYRFPYETFPNGVTVYSDRQQWDKWKKRGDSVLHVELCEWADLMVIAPITANSLAKIAGGYCDNLLMCIVRAWDYKKKPLYVAPSMNSLMWKNPSTKRDCETIEKLGIALIPPVPQNVNGEYECGRMPDASAIYSAVRASYDRWMELKAAKKDTIIID